MKFIRFSRPAAVAAIALICLLLLVPLAGCVRPIGLEDPPAPGRAASLVVHPMSGVERDFITIFGAGFVPGEIIEVVIVVGGVPTRLARWPFDRRDKFYLQANEYGAFFATGSAIPLDTPPGIYTITATGDKGSVATYPLRVLEKK